MSHDAVRLAVLLILALLIAACGQKPGVREIGFAEGGAAPAPVEAESSEPLPEWSVDEDATLDGVGDAEDVDVGGQPPAERRVGGAGATGTGQAGRQTASGATAAQTGGSDPPAHGADEPAGGDPGPVDDEDQDEQPPAGGGDRTGVTDDVIRIGVHAPITGAAPIPQASVERARMQYWNATGPVHGRKVEVFLRDDQYNPSRATQVCNELIQRQQVFILSGIGGVDQIAACARTAAQQGVPYFSSGTVEGLLRRLPTYFAVSMSYRQQATPIVELMKTRARPSNNRIGILRDRSPNFNEVVEQVQTEAERAGFEVLLRQHQNGPSDGQWLQQNQIETAFPIMSPSAFVQVANAPGGRIDHWVGAGPTMGLNSVAMAACPAIDGAMFLSAWSGLNKADDLDPRFNRDAGGGDDIQWAAWTGFSVVHTILDALGRDLTREAFIRHARTQEIKTGIAPTLRHSPDDPFGVEETHLLVADCSQRRFVTPDDGLFVRSFE